MPGKTDDDQLEEGAEEETEEETEETEESTEESTEEGTEGTKPNKRISDLQSTADKETARANKAEAALAAALKRNGSGDGDKTDPGTKALMSELREASLDAIFGEFPEFKEYGIDRSVIEGSTRAELRESAVSLVGLIRGVKTKVRNQVLAENGIKAEPSGSNRQKPLDTASMSDEAFLKMLDAVG